MPLKFDKKTINIMMLIAAMTAAVAAWWQASSAHQQVKEANNLTKLTRDSLALEIKTREDLARQVARDQFSFGKRADLKHLEVLFLNAELFGVLKFTRGPREEDEIKILHSHSGWRSFPMDWLKLGSNVVVVSVASTVAACKLQFYLAVNQDYANKILYTYPPQGKECRDVQHSDYRYKESFALPIYLE